jgi:hypothetical protein
MRTSETPGYIEERSIGRREVDRIGTCIWHDQCHDTVAEIKQDCINIEVSMKSKLEWKVFALFVTGLVLISTAFVLFVAPLVLGMATAVTRMDTNQQHLMEELSIKPIQK